MWQQHPVDFGSPPATTTLCQNLSTCLWEPHVGRCDTPSLAPYWGKGEAIPNFHIRTLLNPTQVLFRALQCGLTIGLQAGNTQAHRVPQPEIHLKHSTIHKCPFSYSSSDSSFVKYTDKSRRLCSSKILSPWREELSPSQT